MASVLAVPVTTVRIDHAAPVRATELQPEPVVRDVRMIRLRQFMSKLHCPIRDMAEDFVHAADDNNLDWRLLPSISIIESGGGKAYKNNNVFGWGNGDRIFPTIRAGIHQVAFKLGKSALYRNLSTSDKLRLYNPYEDYPGRVEDVMERISPVENLALLASAKVVIQPSLELLSRN
jgi:hypothetical protein